MTAVPAQIALVDFENAPDFQFGAASVALLWPSAFDGCDERGRVLLQRRVHRVDRRQKQSRFTRVQRPFERRGSSRKIIRREFYGA